MARGGARNQNRDKPAKAKPPGLKIHRHELSMPLRESLHRLANNLGLFPESDGLEDGGRFRAPVLLPANGMVPQAMRQIFAEEFGVLGRIGKPVDRCHVLELHPFKVYCLPYYYYDGFNALLYLEHKGACGAAWKEQESDDARSPLQVLTPGDLVQFQKMLRQVLEIPSGI